MDEQIQIRNKYELIRPVLNERQRRLWGANEAISYGHGGIKLVSLATGMAPNTISSGVTELKEIVELQGIDEAEDLPHPQEQRVRRAGGGRKRLTQTDPTLVEDLNALMAPATRGDPGSPLCWSSKRTYKLSKELQSKGHQVSPRTVAALLIDQDYTLQSNRKNQEGATHPDRDQQFEHINDKAGPKSRFDM